MNKTSVEENLSITDNTVNVQFFPLWISSTLHMLIDQNGVLDNVLQIDNTFFTKINNQQPLNYSTEYELQLSASALDVDNNQIQVNKNYPLQLGWQTMPIDNNFVNQVAYFNDSVDTVPVEIADKNVLAHIDCIIACGLARYNLALSLSNNIQIDFSHSGNNFELALWNKSRHSIAQNQTNDILFSIDNDQVNLSWIDIEKTISTATLEIVEPFHWRSYRLKIQDNQLTVYLSFDEKFFTELSALAIDGSTINNIMLDEFSWLIGFDGALDKINVSTLDSNGQFETVIGDVLTAQFDNSITITTDIAVNDNVGFDDNIVDFKPMSEEAGSPLQTFGQRGAAYYGEQGSWASRGSAVAHDANNRIYIAGTVFNGVDEDIAVWRLLSDGSIDNSFGAASGTAGRIVVDNVIGTNQDDIAYAITVLNNGNILLVESFYQPNSTTGSDLVLIRLTENGAFDPTFNASNSTVGRVINATNGFDSAYDMILDANENIIIVGESNGLATIWKYQSNGLPDTSFTGSGIIRKNAGWFAAVSINSLNNIIVAGAEINSSNNLTEINSVVYTSSGNLLSEFLTPSGIANSFVADIAVDNQDRLLLITQSDNSDNSDIIIWRVTAANQPDMTFATNAQSRFDSGGNDFAYSIAVDNNNRILALASSDYAGNTLLRY